jgi:integrase
MKAHKAGKRGQRGAGRLYKRLAGGVELPATSEAAGAYWLEYRANNGNGKGNGKGKRIRTPLRDANGQPITDRAAAEAARRMIMAPFLAGDELEAQRQIAARVQTAEARLAVAVEEANPPLRVSEAWAAFLSSPERSDSGDQTLKQYKSHFDQFTEWLTENHPEAAFLRDVTRELASAYAGHLVTRGLSPNRFNKHVTLLRAVWRILAEPAKLTANHWRQIKRKRQVAHSRRELTIEELTAVCKAATGDLRPLFALGIYTGLRLGDCATLKWSEVDLVRGIIRRIPNKTARRNPKPVLVPIHAALRAMLDELPTGKRRQGYVLPDTAATYLHDSATLCRRIQRLFDDSGIACTINEPKKRAVVEVGFHSLRHTFVSLCRAADVPLSVVQAIVGHNTPAMTEHYTHVGDVATRQAITSIPTIGAPALPAGAVTPAPTGEGLAGQLDALRAAVATLAEKLTAANVEETRAAMVALSKGVTK